jgi:hypothetical protein
MDAGSGSSASVADRRRRSRSRSDDDDATAADPLEEDGCSAAAIMRRRGAAEAREPTLPPAVQQKGMQCKVLRIRDVSSRFRPSTTGGILEM